MSTRTTLAIVTLSLLLLAAVAQAHPPERGTLPTPGLRVLGEAEAQAVRGADGSGWKCQSAMTECGPDLGCYLAPGGQQCLWICQRWVYKFCIYDPPSGYCNNTITATCGRKRYCPLDEGHCNDPEHYACRTHRGCTSPEDCEDAFQGCYVELAGGQCPQF